MWKLVFVGFPHTEKYQGGEVKTAIGPDETVEVSEKEANRLLSDFAKAGPGGKPAFRLVDKPASPVVIVEASADPPATGKGKEKPAKKAEQPDG